MRAQAFGQEHVLVFEPGEEFPKCLLDYLASHRIDGGSFTAIGSASHVRLKYFNAITSQYEPRDFHEQLEIASLTGNASRKDGQPFVHAHVVLGDHDFHSYSGHLDAATIYPTLELVLSAARGTLTRAKDPRTGLDALYPGGTR